MMLIPILIQALLINSLVIKQEPINGDLPVPPPGKSPLPHPWPIPTPIELQLYKNLFTYAHLMDISYCVNTLGGLSKPFKCNLDCEERFSDFSLVYQWSADDAVTGYIATTYSNIFNYTYETQTPKKTIVVSLRGTNSIFDSMADLKTDLVAYSNIKYKLPECINCKVHSGFYDYYLNTLVRVHELLDKELDLSMARNEDYEIVIVGHSLGGSVALLLGLYYLDLGFDKLTVVTMGQPLVGNKEFVNWADRVMGSHHPPSHNFFARKYLRVVHKADLVAVIPQNKNFLEPYCQFDNLIYLNTTSTEIRPRLDEVVDCIHGNNEFCIVKDFLNVGFLRRYTRNYFAIHNTYFRQLGTCSVRLLGEHFSEGFPIQQNKQSQSFMGQKDT